MAEEQLRKALALMRQGNKQEASQIAQAIIKQDRNNINAWWLTANLLSDQPERQKKALERVLAINPLHKGALKMMEGLEKGKAVGYQPKSDRPQAKPSQQVMTTQEIEFDWSKLEARDAPKKKQGKPIEADKAARIANIAMLGFILVIAAVVAVYFALPLLQGSPEKVVLDYLNAFGRLDWETMNDLTCEQYRADVDEIQSMFGSMTGGVSMEDLNIDMKNLTAETKSINGDTAEVKVGGEFSISMNGVSMSFDIDELIVSTGATQDATVTLIKQNGNWRVCEGTS